MSHANQGAGMPSVGNTSKAAPEKPLKNLPRLGRILPCDLEDDAEVEKVSGEQEPTANQSVVTEASNLIKQWDAEEEEYNARHRAARGRHYVALLLRASSPQPGDAEQLAELCVELGIAPESMQSDIQALRRAIELLDLHSRSDELRKKAAAATTAYVELQKRHQEEERAAFFAKGVAQGESERAVWAVIHLRDLQARHPHLFTGDRPVPQLLADPPVLGGATLAATD